MSCLPPPPPPPPPAPPPLSSRVRSASEVADDGDGGAAAAGAVDAAAELMQQRDRGAGGGGVGDAAAVPWAPLLVLGFTPGDAELAWRLSGGSLHAAAERLLSREGGDGDAPASPPGPSHAGAGGARGGASPTVAPPPRTVAVIVAGEHGGGAGGMGSGGGGARSISGHGSAFGARGRSGEGPRSVSREAPPGSVAGPSLAAAAADAAPRVSHATGAAALVASVSPPLQASGASSGVAGVSRVVPPGRGGSAAGRETAPPAAVLPAEQPTLLPSQSTSSDDGRPPSGLADRGGAGHAAVVVVLGANPHVPQMQPVPLGSMTTATVVDATLSSVSHNTALEAIAAGRGAAGGGGAAWLSSQSHSVAVPTRADAGRYTVAGDSHGDADQGVVMLAGAEELAPSPTGADDTMGDYHSLSSQEMSPEPTHLADGAPAVIDDAWLLGLRRRGEGAGVGAGASAGASGPPVLTAGRPRVVDAGVVEYGWVQEVRGDAPAASLSPGPGGAGGGTACPVCGFVDASTPPQATCGACFTDLRQPLARLPRTRSVQAAAVPHASTSDGAAAAAVIDAPSVQRPGGRGDSPAAAAAAAAGASASPLRRVGSGLAPTASARSMGRAVQSSGGGGGKMHDRGTPPLVGGLAGDATAGRATPLGRSGGDASGVGGGGLAGHDAASLVVALPGEVVDE
jgi:hypothetical protein